MQVLNDTPVKITDSAMQELLRIREKEQISHDLALRVGVKGGGCSGMSYTLGFDAPAPEDTQFSIDNLTVVVNKAQLMYILNMEIDLHNDLNNRGFIYRNPNAKETCGCGSSFSS